MAGGIIKAFRLVAVFGGLIGACISSLIRKLRNLLGCRCGRAGPVWVIARLVRREQDLQKCSVQ